MAYNKTIWVDNNEPFINAENLNKIENGIETAIATLEENSSVSVGTTSKGDLWVEYSNNLCNFGYLTPNTAEALGLNLIANGSSLSIKGTSNGEGFIFNLPRVAYLEAGTYTFSLQRLNGNKSGNGESIVIYNNTTNSSILDAIQEDVVIHTFTLNQNSVISVDIYCRGAGNTFNDYVLGIQIERGNERTPYKPYVIPSIKVNNNGTYDTIISKNIYAENEIVIGKFMGKPLYRKHIYGTTETEIILLSNIENLVNDNIMVKRSGINQYHKLNACMINFDNVHASSLFINADDHTLRLVITNSTYKNMPFYGFIEYTKTTD